jgi:hypothetical protein
MDAMKNEPQQLPPEAVVMQMVMGAWVARTISDISRLNVPDVLKKSCPLTAEGLIAAGIDANQEALQRVMRACASFSLFTEDAQGRFGITPLSEVLTVDSPRSVKGVAQEVGGLWAQFFTKLPDAIRTGEPQAHQLVGMGWWDYLKANPKEMETFGEAMKSNSLTALAGVLQHCDFSKVKKIVDVGGGYGHLVVALLEKYPNLRGVLQDLPDLIPLAKKNLPVEPGVASRLEYLGADMFESVAQGDAYILKLIIHDWDDDHALRLLRHCHASMDGNGRLICVDSVIPPIGDTSATASKLFDLLMMLGVRGKERTRQQWEELYGAAGFTITSIIPLNDAFGVNIIEGAKL